MYAILPAFVTLLLCGFSVSLVDDSNSDSPTLTVNEGAAAGDVVGRLPVGNATVSEESAAAIARQTPFRVDPETGDLYVEEAGALDYEGRRRIDFTIETIDQRPSDSLRERFLSGVRDSGAREDSLQRLTRARGQVSVQVLVTDSNEPPQLLPVPLLVVVQEGELSAAIPDRPRAWDPDRDDVLHYSIVPNQAGLTVDPLTGQLLLTEVPESFDLPEIQVMIQVTDKAGLYDREFFTVQLPEHPQPASEPTPALPDVASSSEPVRTSDDPEITTPSVAAVATVTDPVESTDVADPLNVPLLPSFAPLTPDAIDSEMADVSTPTVVDVTGTDAPPETTAGPDPVESSADTVDPLVATVEASSEPMGEPSAPPVAQTASVSKGPEKASPTPATAQGPEVSPPVQGASGWFLVALALVTIVVLVQVFVPERQLDDWEQQEVVEAEKETLNVDSRLDQIDAEVSYGSSAFQEDAPADEDDRAVAGVDDLFVLDESNDEDTDEFLVEESLVNTSAEQEDEALAHAEAAMADTSSDHEQRAIQLTEVMSQVLSKFQDFEVAEGEQPAALATQTASPDVLAESEDLESVESVDDWLQRMLGRPGSATAAVLKSQGPSRSASKSTSSVLTGEDEHAMPVPDSQASPTAPAHSTLPAGARVERTKQNTELERQRLASLRKVANESARGHIALARHERTKGLRIVVGTLIPVCFVSGLGLLATKTLGPNSEGLGMALVGTGVALFGLYTSRSRSIAWRLSRGQSLPDVEGRAK